ncbi:hypothetical protein BLNAU_18039 [Blattamonas nauphoetae]|uniref:Uncharacterized protein n=1 Tax=Blattamonas nauphoetae TaxID=2049346 RepID=A0ABQ9X8N5_9EUKA|nr:hypothetical protein BLNAU_18039 [Blattamonas nauphoetae]
MLGSYLSVFRGCDFPSALTDHIAADQDSIQYNSRAKINPAYYLNHTSIDPKHRHSFFPVDLMFERFLRDDPDALLELWSDVFECTSRKFLHTPYVGLHSLLLRYPKLNRENTVFHSIFTMLFVQISAQETTQGAILNLFSLFPPHRLIDTLLSTAYLESAPINCRIGLFNVVAHFGDFTSPFGACSSLAKVFKMLAPFNPMEDRVELKLLQDVGSVVVNLHWFSIPGHFDSPLIYHPSSLAGAQRGGVQTLSSHTGIRSLALPRFIQPNWNTIFAFLSPNSFPSDEVRILSEYFLSSLAGHNILMFITERLFSVNPAIVSATFESFHRFVSVASDAIRIELVKRDANRDETPLYLRTEPFVIQTIEQASQSFLSLVNFVKEGKYLNSKDTRQASAFLESITPHYGSSFSTDQILFELVPTIDGSCSGFTESIVPLLTSSNEELSKSALLLLNEIVFDVTQSSRFDFLETGFFGILPTAFYEQTRHILDTSSLYLMNILYGFMFWSRPDVAGRICQLSHISMDTFQHTFIDKLFRPIGPFLDFICRNRRQITDSANSRVVSLLFDCLHFFQTAIATVNLLRSVMEGVRAWQKDTPAVRKRGHQIVAKLCEEGLSDEIDMLFQSYDVVFSDLRLPSSPAIVPSRCYQPSSPAVITVPTENELRETSTQPIVPPSDTTTPPSPRYSFAMCWNVVFSIPRIPLCTNTNVPPLVLIFLSADPLKIELLRMTDSHNTISYSLYTTSLFGEFALSFRITIPRHVH